MQYRPVRRGLIPYYDPPVNEPGELTDTPPAAVLKAYSIDPKTLRRATSGLINHTWHAVDTAARRVVVQQVNAIFPAEVNADIDALTRHIEARGLLTPRVVPTRDGALWCEHAGRVWRALTEVPGTTYDALVTPDRAREAGHVLARFHRAVAEYDRPFANARLGVHDTAAHLARLEAALDEHVHHRDHRRITALAERVFAEARRLPPLPATTDRVVHGDPKISNILFDDAGRALCLIDLDTLARMPIALELGDAMRSWCNPQEEDSSGSNFSVPYFAAAVEGYASGTGDWLSEYERFAIPAATLTITVELAARFCIDALAERYFRWAPRRYSSASAHNSATRHRRKYSAAETGILMVMGQPGCGLSRRPWWRDPERDRISAYGSTLQFSLGVAHAAGCAVAWRWGGTMSVLRRHSGWSVGRVPPSRGDQRSRDSRTR